MVINDKEFLKKLLATFKVEAEEHLQAISAGLLDLEKSGAAEERAAILESVLREAHSLKGAARSVNLSDVETICQRLESVFAALKDETIRPSAEIFDLLGRAVEGLAGLLATGQVVGGAADKKWMTDLNRILATAVKDMPTTGKEEKHERAEEIPSTPPEESPVSPEGGDEPTRRAAKGPPVTETVRLSVEKLKGVLLQTEEMLSAKVTAAERVATLRKTVAAFKRWKKEWEKVAPLMRKLRAQRARFEQGGFVDRRGDSRGQAKLHEFLELNSTFMKALEEKIASDSRSAHAAARSLDEMVHHLHEEMKKVMLVPFSSLLEIFPRTVRELARDRQKEIDLVVTGGELEVDRRILDEMKDPLLHLLRNGVDHGIEKPEVRTEKGKPPRGTITIAVAPQSGGKVEITVADDGAGIDLATLRAAAEKLGVVPRKGVSEPAEEDLLATVFHSGVSTSPIITEISGRGLGLAIVQEKAERLGGTVTLETHAGAGTTFRIVLPMSIATFRGIMVRVEGRPFILPTSHVHRVLRVAKEEIKTVENRPTIEVDGRALSLARLADVLELPPGPSREEGSDTVPAAVLTAAGQSLAFAVDEVVGEGEVLLKNLGSQLSRVRNVAGATVLGSGEVVAVLNVIDLMKSALVAPSPAAAPTEKGGPEKTKSVLVVEDSITSRTFLKNVLETAGYAADTAVDGVEAFAKLRNGDYDIVVSDVDMPRMNGFDLTARIREDKKLVDLPVVLVTALESRAHRERGIDVGANAYIVKSSFDHSNLLDILGRLT